MELQDVNTEIVSVPDPSRLSEGMLRAAVGDRFTDAQIRVAMEVLDSNDGKLPPGRTRRIPPALIVAIQRERWIAVMLKTVSELGYANVTIDDLTQQASMSRRALYYFFEGTEECFQVALEEVTVQLIQRLETAASRGGDNWRDRLQVVLEELLSFTITEFNA